MDREAWQTTVYGVIESHDWAWAVLILSIWLVLLWQLFALFIYLFIYLFNCSAGRTVYLVPFTLNVKKVFPGAILIQKIFVVYQVKMLQFINGYCCLVTKSCPSLVIPMYSSPPGSSVHGISQATIEWIAISFSKRSSQPRDPTYVFCLAGVYFPTEPPGKPISGYILLRKSITVFVKVWIFLSFIFVIWIIYYLLPKKIMQIKFNNNKIILPGF